MPVRLQPYDNTLAGMLIQIAMQDQASKARAAASAAQNMQQGLSNQAQMSMQGTRLGAETAARANENISRGILEAGRGIGQGLTTRAELKSREKLANEALLQRQQEAQDQADYWAAQLEQRKTEAADEAAYRKEQLAAEKAYREEQNAKRKDNPTLLGTQAIGMADFALNLASQGPPEDYEKVVGPLRQRILVMRAQAQTPDEIREADMALAKLGPAPAENPATPTPNKVSFGATGRFKIDENAPPGSQAIPRILNTAGNAAEGIGTNVGSALERGSNALSWLTKTPDTMPLYQTPNLPVLSGSAASQPANPAMAQRWANTLNMPDMTVATPPINPDEEYRRRKAEEIRRLLMNPYGYGRY